MTVVARTRYRRGGIHANRVGLAAEARLRESYCWGFHSWFLRRMQNETL